MEHYINYIHISFKKYWSRLNIYSNNGKDNKNIYVNYIKDHWGTWMKVGIFKNNASDSITQKWNSTTNLSIATKQDTSTAFSADFGEMRPTEVKYLVLLILIIGRKQKQ